MRPTFHFLVTTHNADKWITGCIGSLCAQRDQPFTINVVIDGATDATVPRAMQALASCPPITRTAKPARDRITVNHRRLGALRNQWDMIMALSGFPEDIVVIVDGDDELAHEDVLNVLAGHYRDPDLVLTYGSYRPEPRSITCASPRPYPDRVARERSFRRYASQGNLLFNHLRTFRLGAARQIDPARNLCWPGGEWFQTCADTAIMIPLLELAGTHYRCLDEVLYLYNSANPNSDWRRDSAEIDRTHHYILNTLTPIVTG